ncbi:MAG: UvrD-helicase domain-containing protein [Clostridia bacterium]|nr:UvrD-helicase domain-containing protein [Clostridia bacterium]
MSDIKILETPNDRFTEEQRAAINAKGRTIVSASAGSGKTTVMIEKMIRLIKDEGVSVSEILAVTYTKKAAAQMKEKLRKALVKAYNDPATDEIKKKRLKREYESVPSADISTIHSFCSKLIKTHFYAVGVGNRFTIIAGDDADGVALKNRALDEMFEEAYDSDDEDFSALLSVYFRKKSDNRLRKIFNTVYDKMRTHTNYRTIEEKAAEACEATFDKICAEIYEKIREKCAYYAAALQKSRLYFSAGGGSSARLVEEVQALLDEILRAGDLFAACKVQKPSFTRKENTKKQPQEYAEEVERLAFIKDKAAAIVTKELSQFSDRETELNAYLSASNTARALAKYLLLFDARYAALKREKGILDYNDLEHFALELLNQAEIREEMRKKYRYVFVDEYQDVNPVQEAILSKVSGENVFLVGDIKQAIYGFRGSKSEYFAQKQNEYEQDPQANSLLLTKNFRSSDAVLDAVNGQFSLAMTLDNSSVDYVRDSKMLRGGLYGEGSGRVRVHFTGKEETEKDERRGVYSVRAHAGRREANASLMAKKIHEIVKSERLGEWYDTERKQYRRVRYSDIAVLSRKKSGEISEVIAALAAEGVPVTAAAAVNICDYPEIKTLIDILKLVDNERQDIPLCSALLSSMGGLNEDDLVKIRTAYSSEKSFRESCYRYADGKTDALSTRLKDFFAYLRSLRTLSQVSGAGEVLSRVLVDTNMEAALLGGKSGESCLKRIHRFLEETRTPEAMDVHEFLERLKMLDYEIEYCENGGEDAVRVVTMHSSKGLEYPVVIVENLSGGFHGADNDDVFFDEEYGLAPKCFDAERMLQRSTVLRRLNERKQLLDEVKNELNIYYVALTRAQYALHMIFTEKQQTADIRYARSFAELTTFSVWEKYETAGAGVELPYETRQPIVGKDIDEELTKEIENALDWHYAHGGCEAMPAKTSATALMKLQENRSLAFVHAFDNDLKDEETHEDNDVEGETSQEIGLAYHAFLEHFDFSLLKICKSREAVGERVVAELARMKADGAFEEGYFKLLEAEKLTEILCNPIFKSLDGMELYRERKFLAALPACDVLELLGNRAAEGECCEDLLFQGAIDLLAVGEGRVRIIDYKYSQKGAEALKQTYGLQLNLYKKAVARIMKLDETAITCTIVNIYRGFEVEMD